jgi:GTP-binding protein hflX
MREEQIQEAPVKVLLVGVDVGEEPDFERSMEELASLAEAAEKEVAGQMVQRLDHVNKALYIGTGKVTEVRRLAEECGAQEIVFDNSLTPSQVRNLGNELELPIIDRTNLILDIFAIRAQTREAKLQVETARLQYMLPRLVGMYDALSRQGGASGSMSNKGTGEKKLELDRRKIEHRITELKKELEDVGRTREVQRKKRQQSRIPQVALVGYTNAGKSTILNRMVEQFGELPDKTVMEKDMLFATLETSVRSVDTGHNKPFFLTDTVGFIRKLPHHLIDAFRSTLEEAKFADIILHVVDISNPQADLHILTVYDTLRELGVKDKPVVTLFNKIDKMDELPAVKDFQADHTLYISARQETGFEKITDVLAEIINQSRIYIEQTIPYAKAGVIQQIRKSGNLLEEEYREDGIFVRAYVDAGTKGLL